MTELILSFPATGGIILSTVGIQGPPGGGGGGGGVTDGDKGGIVVSGSGAIWTVKDGSITDLMLSASATALFAAASHTHSIAHITGLQAALDGKQAALGFTPENAAQKGVAGGYAGLDGTGKVPAAQLPAYVDDVVEAANFAALPGTGETGKIYVTLDTNKTLRWSGSAYVEISPSPGSTDSVTEGSVNLYFTAARARATDLTGYAAAGSRIALVAGDTFIGAMGKLGRWVADLGQAAFAAASTAGLNMLTAANAAAQTALLDTFTSGAKGLAPASGGGTTNVLRADGTWAAPPGGGTQPQSIIVAVGDETTTLTTGTGKVTFRMPYAFTLTGIRASVKTAQASGSILTVDVNEEGTSILSTKLTIDNGEKSSTTAATAAVMSDTSLADDAEITIDIDQVGTGGVGLKVALIGYPT